MNHTFLYVAKYFDPTEAFTLPKREQKNQEGLIQSNVNKEGRVIEQTWFCSKQVENPKSLNQKRIVGHRRKWAVFPSGLGLVALHECSTISHQNDPSRKCEQGSEKKILSPTFIM